MHRDGRNHSLPRWERRIDFFLLPLDPVRYAAAANSLESSRRGVPETSREGSRAGRRADLHRDRPAPSHAMRAARALRTSSAAARHAHRPPCGAPARPLAPPPTRAPRPPHPGSPSHRRGAARAAAGAESLARTPARSRSRGSRSAAALFLLIGGEPIGEPVVQRKSGLHDGSRASTDLHRPCPCAGPRRSLLPLSLCVLRRRSRRCFFCLPTPLLRKMAGLNASSVGS